MARTVPSATLTAEEEARLRRRYPASRLPRPLLVALVGILALVGLAWLVWAAAFHSRPPVAAQVSAFTVQSDQRMAVTLTVDRLDPSVRVSCRVRAQAVDFTPVGEQTVSVPPAKDRLVNVRLTLTTVRRATSASVAECFVV